MIGFTHHTNDVKLIFVWNLDVVEENNHGKSFLGRKYFIS